MKVYEFGKDTAPVILLLPGTACHWKINYEKHIPLLEQSFRVAAVSYDGFDETENTVFPDMITECEKIEAWVTEHYGGMIFAAYGCSLGGSFVSLLIQRRRIHIEHGILGSSDMDQAGPLAAKIETRIIGAFLVPMIRTGKVPGLIRRMIARQPEEKQDYIDRLLSSFSGGGQGMPFVKKESICNQFYSDLVTKVDDGIDVPGTTVHIFYALKMGEKYEQRYRQHFARPDIVRHDLEHEELFFLYPEKWYEEVLRVTGMR